MRGIQWMRLRKNSRCSVNAGSFILLCSSEALPGQAKLRGDGSLGYRTRGEMGQLSVVFR